jgi:hypothetical protein
MPNFRLEETLDLKKNIFLKITNKKSQGKYQKLSFYKNHLFEIMQFFSKISARIAQFQTRRNIYIIILKKNYFTNKNVYI